MVVKTESGTKFADTLASMKENKAYSLDLAEKQKLNIGRERIIHDFNLKDWFKKKIVKIGEKTTTVDNLVRNLKFENNSKNPNRPRVSYNGVEIGRGSEVAAIIQVYAITNYAGLDRYHIDGKIGKETIAALEGTVKDNVESVDRLGKKGAIDFVNNNGKKVNTISRFVNDWIKKNNITFTAEDPGYGKIRIFCKIGNEKKYIDIEPKKLYEYNSRTKEYDEKKGLSVASLNTQILLGFHWEFFNRFQEKSLDDIIKLKAKAEEPANDTQKNQRYRELSSKCNEIISNIIYYINPNIRHSIYNQSNGNNKFRKAFEDLLKKVKEYKTSADNEEMKYEKKLR